MKTQDCAAGKIKGHFWLYNGDVRVCGLYGIFCQYTDEPKEYTLSDEQAAIVLDNLKSKIKREVGGDIDVPLLKELANFADTGARDFDNVRAITVDGVLWKKFTTGWQDSIMKFFFVTYGNNLIGCYTPIEAEDYATARKIAYEGTDKGKFAFMYTGQDELDRQIAEGYLNGGAVELQPMEV